MFIFFIDDWIHFIGELHLTIDEKAVKNLFFSIFCLFFIVNGYFLIINGVVFFSKMSVDEKKM